MHEEQQYLSETVENLLERGLPNVMLVVRHSIRTTIGVPDVKLAYSAPLTAEGQELAWQFGRMLSNDHPATLRFSRVPRCEDTAHFIRRGIIEKGGHCEIVGRREYLEAPYVVDPVQVMEVFVKSGTAGFAERWASGKLGTSMIGNIESTGRSFLDRVLEVGEKENSGTLSIFVTHDLTLLALLSLVFDVTDPEFPWPDYMGGAVLAREEDSLILHYRGMRKPLC